MKINTRKSIRVFSALAAAAVLLAAAPGAQPASAQATNTLPIVNNVWQTSPVQLLVASKAGTRDIQITWAPPQSTLSPITQYRITVVTNNAAALPSPAAISVAASTTAVVFRGLILNESYTFIVQPETAQGPGQPSAQSNAVFLGDGSEKKPNPPQNVAAFVLNQSQVQVTWSPPAPKANVAINKYRITTQPGTRTTDVSAGLNYALLTGFKPGVAYVVRVQAISTENRGSDLANSAAISFALPPTQPPVTLPPPTTVTTTSTTTTTLLPLPSPVEVPTLTPTKRCTTRVWDPSYLGRPSRLAAGAPVGAYLWTDGRAIHLRTYNNSNTPVRFSGTVSAKVSMPTAKFYLEPDADSVSVGRTAASFSFSSAYDLDALRFDGRCVTKLTVKLFINGQPMPPNQIFIGANNINPPSSAFVLSR
jgi:hypothetical protein